MSKSRAAEAVVAATEVDEDQAAPTRQPDVRRHLVGNIRYGSVAAKRPRVNCR